MPVISPKDLMELVAFLDPRFEDHSGRYKEIVANRLNQPPASDVVNAVIDPNQEGFVLIFTDGENDGFPGETLTEENKPGWFPFQRNNNHGQKPSKKPIFRLGGKKRRRGPGMINQ